MTIVRGIAVTTAVGLGLVASVWLGELHGVVLFTVYAGTGAYLAIRRPVNPLGWLLILVGWGFSLGSAGTYSQPDAFVAAATTRLQLVFWASSTAWTLVFVGLLAITLTYPGGRLANGRAGRLARAALGLQAALALLIMSSPTMTVTTSAVMTISNPFALLPGLPLWRVLPSTNVLYAAMLVIVVAGLVSMLRRWRRAQGLERQQFRWLVAALVVVSVATTVWAWVSFILGQPPNGPANILAVVSFSTVPAAIAVAVLRYHLYEIDRIISRTLTYVGVTVGLFAVFVAANLVAQWVLAPFTNGNAIAVAGSTLLAAAAFSPLRARLQAIVDRRFNRGRYDAERTIDAFAGRLRDELDLAALAEALLGTTRVAVEPATTAVWLRGGVPR